MTVPVSPIIVPDPTPKSVLDRAFETIPPALASKLHLVFLALLGIWLIVIPVVPGTEALRPGANGELIGGNWANISSALGACIAAGYSLALHSNAKKHRVISELALRLVADLHALHVPQAPATPAPAPAPAAAPPVPVPPDLGTPR